MSKDTRRWVELVATLLVVVGAVNWGLIGLGWLVGGGANWNIVNMLLGGLGTMVEAVVYVLVGAAGLWLLYNWWMGMSKK